jgi:hypothetical protein
MKATIVSGGGFFALKGVPQDANPRRMTVWLHEERSSVSPYGAPDQRTMFTPERIAIEKLDSTMVAERYAPRDSFAGHQMNTPWDPLHRAYFNGEALWTYLTTPFLLAMDGVRVEETEPWRQGSETWRVLRAYFPASIETHSLIQDFFFGEDLLLKNLQQGLLDQSVDDARHAELSDPAVRLGDFDPFDRLRLVGSRAQLDRMLGQCSRR